MSTDIKQLEFELEKARHGLVMPYDRERVLQLETQLREARQKLRMRKGQQMAAKLRVKLSNSYMGACFAVGPLSSSSSLPKPSRLPS